MKKAIIFLSSLVGMAGIALVFVLKTQGGTFGPLPDRNVRMAQIGAQERVLKEGDRLMDQGLYEQALAKYEKGLDSKFIGKDEDRWGPIYRKIRFYRITNNYVAGLKEFHEASKKQKLDNELELELEALQKFSESGSRQAVYDFIGYIKEKYRDSLPPVAYNSFSPIPIAQIFRLYSAINDYDAGIAYLDEILNWTFEVDRPEFRQLRTQIQNVQQASQCAGLDIFPVTKRHPDWNVCKWLREYLLVREGFEQDKAEGFKGCASKKPGEECVGHAMKALIKSDYFPW